MDIDRVCEEFIQYFRPFIMLKLKDGIEPAQLDIVKARLQLFVEHVLAEFVEYVDVYE